MKTNNPSLLTSAAIFRIFGLFLVMAVITPVATAIPEVIAVGKGSYASEPPADAGKDAAEMAGFAPALVDPSVDRAIPTNKYWTNLLKGKPAGELWVYPFRVDPKETGIELFFPKEWNAKGELRSGPGNGLFKITGVDFRSGGALLVKDWGDWTLSFRLPQKDGRYLDVTVGEGMPCVWIEPRGVDLVLSPGGGAVFTDARGRAAQFPFGGDRLVVAVEGRTYGLFFPPSARLVREGDALRLTFAPGAESFLTVAAMPGPGDLAMLGQAAYSVPRDSRMEWAFDAARGKVTTTWTVKTEPLLPGKPDAVAQGWLAHHWRDTALTMKLDGPAYVTPRGPMKTSVGNTFGITYEFEGVLPFLPPPAKLGLPNDYDPERMAQLLAASAMKTNYGNDTYWGAKDLTRFTQYLQMARELKDTASYPALLASAQTSLTDWLTYTPGETEHYFARYPNWRALIGFKTSYGSGKFNDQHFHYGYFTYAGALLGMEDPAFLRDYGAMLKLVAKQYANWERTDTRFPLLRTFDIWAGHSWAGGTGAPGGNNQESTSEAVQSWIGLFYLGQMLDDPAMTAAGAMGYAMETRATMEYWFNTHGDVFSPNYRHPVIGVLWSGGQVYGTYFTGDPAWIYAIQTLPQCPGLDFLARNPTQARELYHTMLAERKKKEGSDDLARMGDLGSVMLAVAALVDTPYAVAEFDRLWAAGSKNVTGHNASGTTYYQAHAYRRLGRRQFDVRTSLPTSAVYYNKETELATFAAYNPKPQAVVVRVSKAGRDLGVFTAAPRTLTVVNRLEPAR